MNSLCFIALRIKTCHWQLFICTVFILQLLNLVHVRYFSKRLFFSLTRTLNPKKPYFTILLSWDVKKSSQREADVFRLKFDVKRCSYKRDKIINIVSIASDLKHVFDIATTSQKSALLKLLLKDCKLNGKTLEYELNKPFDKLLSCPNYQEWTAITINNLDAFEKLGI